MIKYLCTLFHHRYSTALHQTSVEVAAFHLGGDCPVPEEGTVVLGLGLVIFFKVQMEPVSEDKRERG